MNCWKNLLRIILKRIKSSIILLLIFLLIGNSFSIVRAEQQEHRKAVVVMVNFMNLQDMMDMPHTYDVMQRGAVALMNTRGSKSNTTVSAYATLGWGTRADALSEQGFIEFHNGSLHIRELKEIKAYNQNNSYNVYIGSLGEFFHLKGYTTSFIGIHPSREPWHFPGAFIAMDTQGIIDDGKIINVAQLDRDVLYSTFEAIYAVNQLVTIDFGNVFHLAEYFKVDKKTILQEVDLFIGKLAERVHKDRTLLVILSPHYSAMDAEEGKKLTPVVYYHSRVSPGLLVSDTTRRAGIIGNIDIAPSIADFFGGKLNHVTGEPVTVKPSKNHLDKVMSLYKLTAFNSNNRQIVLKTYIGFQIVLLFLTLVLLLVPKRNIWGLKNYLRALVLFTLVCPLTLFMMPLLHINHLVIYAVGLIGLNTAVTYVIYRLFSDMQSRIICISLLTASAVIVDLVIQGPLNKTSLLGYDAIIGARYYGLGNEYMGVLIAAALLAVVPMVHKKLIPNWVGVMILLCIVPIIGLSVFGANVGGTITATIAFGYAILTMYRKKITVKKMILLGLFMVSVVISFAIYDLYFSPRQSHLAKAISQFYTGGFEVILNIIHRKVEMNLKLMRWTIWSRVLIMSVIVLIVLFLKPKGLLGGLLNKYKNFSRAWYAIIVASFVGMAVNDSGVVVAATANIFLIFSLLYFTLGEENFLQGGK